MCAHLCYCCVRCNGCTQNNIISCTSGQDIVMWPHSIPMTSYRASERRVMLTAHHMNVSHALTSNELSGLFLAAQYEALCTGWLSDRRPQWKQQTDASESVECGGRSDIERDDEEWETTVAFSAVVLENQDSS